MACSTIRATLAQHGRRRRSPSTITRDGGGRYAQAPMARSFSQWSMVDDSILPQTLAVAGQRGSHLVPTMRVGQRQHVAQMARSLSLLCTTVSCIGLQTTVTRGQVSIRQAPRPSPGTWLPQTRAALSLWPESLADECTSHKTPERHGARCSQVETRTMNGSMRLLARMVPTSSQRHIAAGSILRPSTERHGLKGSQKAMQISVGKPSHQAWMA